MLTTIQPIILESLIVRLEPLERYHEHGLLNAALDGDLYTTTITVVPGPATMQDYLDKAKEFLPKNFSREHFDKIYELQTIQRCFKACGSFSSFYNNRSDTRYLKYISSTLRRVLKSLNEFPEYKLFADVLIDSGAIERKYEAL